MNYMNCTNCKEKKVILILVDGMRPDGLLQCGNPYLPVLLENSYVFLNSETVMPSVTLPCHMSLFHSVPPQRHGILTNTWVPQVRPVNGLFEVLKQNNKISTSFYNWEQLRDLGRPGTISSSTYFSISKHENSDLILTDIAINYIEKHEPDFIFLYLGITDAVGHEYGWMSHKYKEAISNALFCIEKTIQKTKDLYTYVITSDHGGHDRSHGSDMSEDMKIPIIIHNKTLSPSAPHNTSIDADNTSIDMDMVPNIIDIAPTIAYIMGISPDVDWEGKNLLKQE